MYIYIYALNNYKVQLKVNTGTYMHAYICVFAKISACELTG